MFMGVNRLFLTLMMISRSGTIIVTPRNNAFRFSGSSCLPAYPGFMVMKKAQMGSRRTFCAGHKTMTMSEEDVRGMWGCGDEI